MQKNALDVILDLGYVNTLADQDVWRRKATTPNGFEYYKLVLIYMGTLLWVSHALKGTMDKLGGLYNLKDTVKLPDRYLGTNIGRWTLPDGQDV